MKALAGSAVAIVLAAILLHRVRRGRRVVLGGRFASGAVRAAALLLLLLDGERAQAAGTAPATPADGLTRLGSGNGKPERPSAASLGGVLPAAIAGEGLRRWARRREDARTLAVVRSLSAWHAESEPARRADHGKDVLANGAALPDVLREPIAAAVAGDATPLPPRAAIAALDAMEAEGLWQPSLAAFLWRRVAAPEDPARLPELYARVETHLRVCETLTKTAALTGPVRYTPWMSKAAPPKTHEPVRVPPDFEATAKTLFPQTPAGTWETDATLGFTVVEAPAPAVLHRRGETTRAAAGGFVRLRRLDVLEAESRLVLEHATLGRIAVPAGTRLTAWSLPALLPPATQASLEKDARAAVAGDLPASQRLEAVLFVAHRALRDALAADPHGARAAALRGVLVTFDE